jgi:hypothetical protein
VTEKIKELDCLSPGGSPQLAEGAPCAPNRIKQLRVSAPVVAGLGRAAGARETLCAHVGISRVEDDLGERVGGQCHRTAKVDKASGDPTAALAVKEPGGWLAGGIAMVPIPLQRLA